MRGVETRIQEIRHRVFREVARMAYHTEWPVDKRIESLPYKIIPGEVGNFRNDVFLERAIVGERLRLAMGLPCRSAAEHAPLSENIEAADRPDNLRVVIGAFLRGKKSNCDKRYYQNSYNSNDDRFFLCAHNVYSLLNFDGYGSVCLVAPHTDISACAIHFYRAIILTALREKNDWIICP